jgi:hypothetical protein
MDVYDEIAFRIPELRLKENHCFGEGRIRLKEIKNNRLT